MADDDAPIQYDAIYELASTLAQKTAPSFRGNSIDREEIFRLYEKLGQYVPMRQNESSPLLSERVKRIYPVVHRAYNLFIGTAQGDNNVDSRKIRAKEGWFGATKGQLGIFDNPHYGPTYPDCAVIIPFYYSPKCPYIITRFRPTWKRGDRHYNSVTGAVRANGESVAPDECIDIRSAYFRIDCLPPEEFVRTLAAGGSEPVLRQTTLDHLLSLPEILGPYLDRKEQGKLTSKR